jgi:hypothetical protein
MRHKKFIFHRAAERFFHPVDSFKKARVVQRGGRSGSNTTAARWAGPIKRYYDAFSYENNVFFLLFFLFLRGDRLSLMRQKFYFSSSSR